MFATAACFPSARTGGTSGSRTEDLDIWQFAKTEGILWGGPCNEDYTIFRVL